MTASANPRCRLAPRTSSQQCVHNLQNSFTITFNPIPERLDYRQLMQLLTAFHHHRRRSKPTKAFTGSPNGIQSP